MPDCVHILVVGSPGPEVEALAASVAAPDLRILVAGSAADASTLLDGLGVAVAVLDLRSPGLDGLATAAALRARSVGAETPVLFVTSRDVDEATVVQACALGGVDFLTTPFANALLRAKVAVFVDFFRRRRDIRLEVEEAERAVKESRDRLTLIYDNVTEHVMLLGVEPDGFRCLSVNAAIRRFRRQPAAALEGRLVADIVPASQVPLVVRSYGEAMLGETVAYEASVEQGREFFTFDTRILPIFDGRGHCTHLLSVARDITERKKAEEALRRTEEQFRQSQKMEAVGRLAGGVAHDFNNLLTAINGYSDLLLGGIDDASPQAGANWREYLHEIKAAGERAASLTRQLLAYSRKQVLAPKILNMNSIVGDMDKMLRRVIGEDVELVTTLADDLREVRVDPSQMQQVLLNLAVNARDAMPAGGRLSIQTASVEVDESARSGLPMRPGSYVLVTVRDTGKGMDAETKARLFEPFYTTKKVGEGTGLGLSTVYGIVQQSGGHIAVDSALERGAVFSLYLPAAPRPAGAASTTLRPRDVPRGKETILLVEDEETVRRLVAVVLRSSGYRVLEADNGVSALRAAESHPEGIQLLLTDVVMPGMGGRELAEKLKGSRPDLRVVFMSGYTDDAMVRHGVRDSSALFLQKPFSPGRVAGIVRDVLDAADASNVPLVHARPLTG